MTKIRFGIIGTNTITERFIASLESIHEATITSVYSRTTERAEAFAKQYQIPYTFTDLEEMLQSGMVDAVYIASPNVCHTAQAILCMRHKKHVLCEKPMASNRFEVEEMIAVAKEENVILMEAIKNVHAPNFKLVQQSLAKIGTPRKYFANFCQYSSRYDRYREGEVLNAFKPELSNGALLDIGVYCLAPMVSLFGEPLKIQATGVMLESGVDGEGSIICSYPKLTAIVQYSKISSSTLASEIQGEDGNIIINKISQMSEVTCTSRTGDTESIGEFGREDLHDETQDFVKLILDNDLTTRDTWLEHSRLVMSIMDTAREQIGLCYPADQVVADRRKKNRFD